MKTLYISAHGKPGKIIFGPDNLESNYYDADSDNSKYENIPIPPELSKNTKAEIDRQLSGLAMLRAAAKYMCKPGKVVFVVCAAGAGPSGETLRQNLNSIFGPKVEIELHSKLCGFRHHKVVELNE